MSEASIRTWWLLELTGFHAAACCGGRRFGRGLWYVQHSSEKKRDEADTALVESGGWVQACGGVETRATLLYSWLCGLHPSPGTARGRVTH